MMDHQLVEMIRDRFDQVDEALRQANQAFTKHADMDALYWRKLDEQRAQLNLIQRMWWGLVTMGGVVLTWLGLRH